MMILRNFASENCLHAEWDRRHPCDAVAKCHVPEARSRKPWLDNHGSARPEGRQHRIRLRVRVEERQNDLSGVCGGQPHVSTVHLHSPDHVGMRPQHCLRPRCCARGELDTKVREWIYRPFWCGSALGHDIVKAFIIDSVGHAARRSRIGR